MIARPLLSAFLVSTATAAYDPLALSPGAIGGTRLMEATDAKRQTTIPLRVYLPTKKEPTPVILFSHGLGGSRDNNPYLGEHWSARGYVVIFMQHAGSDERVWKDAPVGGKFIAMKAAASAANAINRTKDVTAVLDSLEKWNKEKGGALGGRLDLKHIGMSGHSFGAVTTQQIAGERMVGRFSLRDGRIKAAVMMSPSPPAAGDPKKAFGEITIPCLLMTGTKDDSLIGNTTAVDRLKVFPAMTKAPAWEVVFKDAAHMDFGQRAVTLGKPTRYHRAILALTTAFWDAQLKNDATAKEWLDGHTAATVMAPGDRWLKNRNTGMK